jgi:hypothetical protein
MNEILKIIAQAIATVLGGPIANVAVSFLADKLGVPDKTKDGIEQALMGMTAADMIRRLKELDYEFQKFMAENNIKLQLAQLDVAREEARNINWFIAGARPFILWTCGVAFAYAAVVEPLLRFSTAVFGGYKGEFPDLDTTITMQVLFGMLGLGAYRTVEKVTNAEDRRS